MTQLNILLTYVMKFIKSYMQLTKVINKKDKGDRTYNYIVI